MSNVIRSEFSLTMTIGGTVFDVIQFGSDFALNAIPVAEAVIAVGRRASDGTTEAAIHKAIEKLTFESKVQVYLCPIGQWSQDIDWPDGPHLIFEGRLLNVGYTKVSGKIQLVVRLVHWLSDLNHSSAVSSISHPSNPAEYTFQSIISSTDKAGAAQRAAGLAGTSAANLLTIANIQQDLWGEAIKPFLCSLGRNDTTRIDAGLKECFDIEGNDNSQAIAALSRIEGAGGDCAKPLSCYTPMLGMNANVGDAHHTVAEAISRAILFDSVQSFANTTLWAKLVGYMSMFGAAVVPQIDKALVVPYIPCLRSVFCKSIGSCDYTFVNMSQQVSQLLRGIALTGSMDFQAGTAPTGDRSIASLVGVGGCYAPPGLTKGMIKFVAPPPWLRDVPYAGFSAKKVLGITSKKAFSSATTPKVDQDADLMANKDNLKKEDIAKNISDLYDAYAKYVYATESLRGRFGTISGKLRFDIAPGSSVSLAGSAEQFMQQGDALAQNMIGSVMRVSIGINAESSQAGTTFALTNIRTEKENEDDKFSMDTHPLYDAAFTGAPMLDALWFREEGNGCCEEE